MFSFYNFSSWWGNDINKIKLKVYVSTLNTQDIPQYLSPSPIIIHLYTSIYNRILLSLQEVKKALCDSPEILEYPKDGSAEKYLSQSLHDIQLLVREASERCRELSINFVSMSLNTRLIRSYLIAFVRFLNVFKWKPDHCKTIYLLGCLVKIFYIHLQ